MARLAESLGVEISLGEDVTGLDFEGRKCVGVRTNKGAYRSDALVINAMISANRRPPQTWTAMMQRLATVGLSEFVDRLIEAAPRAT